jgi:glycosyltransferase involved in cell wall biosynthesis
MEIKEDIMDLYDTGNYPEFQRTKHFNTKKTVHIYPGYPHVGGVITVIQNVAERLAKKGYNVEVITSKTKTNSRNEYINGVCVKRFKIVSCNIFEFPDIGWIREIMKIRNSIIHIHGFHTITSFFAILLIHSSNILIYNTYYHGKSGKSYRNPLLKLYLMLFNLIIKKVDAIVCISQYEQRKVVNAFKIPRKDTFIIPVGYNLSKMLKYQRRPINDDYKKVLYVGRIVKHKNVHKLVESLKYLENAKLTIIGSGDYEKEVKKVIEKFNLQNRIQWKKNLSYEELLEEYCNADVFVLPSVYESFGMVVGEATLIGCPTIVANSYALTEFVDAGLAEGLSIPIDSREIAEKIKNMPDKSPREKAIEYFKDWDEVTDRYEHIYKKLIITNIEGDDE